MTISTKPVVKGPIDGNIFAILGASKKALERAGMRIEAKDLSAKVLSSGSYDEALSICMEYVVFDLGEQDDD